MRKAFIFFAMLFVFFAFADTSNTINCDKLDKKRFRIDQENIIDITEPVYVYVNVSSLIDTVEIAPSKDNRMDVKADSRLHLATNINNFTVDVKKKGKSIIVETNEYPKEVRMQYCEKRGKSVIYITLPLKNIDLLVFKGSHTRLKCKGISVGKMKVKAKFENVLLSDCTIGELSIKTYNGDIALKNLKAGKFSVYGGFGNISLTETEFGKTFVSLLSGDIESFGEVSMDNALISTTFGDIVLDLKNFKSLDFKTDSGDVILGLKNPSEIYFDGKTEFGDFYLKFKGKENLTPENDKLVFGDKTKPQIKIQTRSGDIELRKTGK